MLIGLVPRRSELWRAWNALLLCILMMASLCPQLFALNPDWQIYQYGHRGWKVGDTFPGSFVNAIAQDAAGYLWIGTNTGLFRFDGIRFTPWIPPPEEHMAGAVVSLLADRDGTLWIGTVNGLTHWDHDRLSHYKKEGGVGIGSIVQDDDGAVWFAPASLKNNSRDILCKVTHGQLTCDGPHAEIASLLYTTTLARDSSGTMWLGESDSIISWRDGSFSSHPSHALRNNLSQEGIRAIVADSDGSLLVGMSKRGPGLGLQRFRNGQWTTVTAPGFDGSDHRVNVLWMEPNHALWIGTADEGMYRLYQGKVDHYSSHDGLSSETVVAIRGDHEGSVWVGTSEGLDQFRDLTVQAFSRTIYPKAQEFDNLVATPDGAFWVGGDSTLYELGKGSKTFTPRGVNLTGRQLTTIFGDSAGRMWIGADNTLNLFSEGRFTPVKMPDERPTGFIVSMAEESDGSLWAITTGPPRTILSINPHTMRATPGLPAVEASKIAGDPRGGLWIGSNTGGISHFSNGKLDHVPSAQETGTRISQLSAMPNGGVLASGEFGLAYLLDRSVRILDVGSGLPCANVNNFVFDEKGDLWLYTQCGLMEISQSQFTRWQSDSSTLIAPRLFDSSDGFRTYFPPFEGAARSADGRLWFNCLESLQMVDPDHLYVNTVPPPVHIEAIRADFHDHPLAQTMQLPPLTRDIEIDYSALSFAVPQKIQFRYKLSGFDPNWQDVGTRRQAVFMNLKPGTYRFQVIASNNDGAWNTVGDALSFTIPPKFYQTQWFLACIVLTSLALIYVLFLVRVRVSTRLVEGRMHERLLERDRIARELHDTLLQGFQGIVLRMQGIARLMSDVAPPRLALEDTMDRADQILIEGRRSLLHLRTNASGSAGLAAQLNDVITDLQLQKDVPCALSVNGQECALKPTVYQEVFAMAREAITNAFRHSDATSVVVELSYTRTQFSFRCSDNGVGLPATVLETGSAEGHWGLVGLKERAENLHAQVNLRSNEPHGTVVEITLRARIAYPNQGLRRLRRLIPDAAE